MRFPVVLKTSDELPAPGTLYYVVAENGVFQVRDNGSYRAVTRSVGGVPGLLPERERVELRFPRLSAALLADVLAFFREVYERHRGEAIAILFYDARRDAFEVRVPPQTIAGYRDAGGRWRPYLRLDYESVPRPAGCVRFGTIHSHADTPAYASAVDCEDERFEDGLHVIYGSFQATELSRSASFVANGQRFRVEPDDVLEPCAVPQRPAPQGWMAQVCVVDEGVRRWGSAVVTLRRPNGEAES